MSLTCSTCQKPNFNPTCIENWWVSCCFTWLRTCWEPAWGILPVAKVMRKGAWQNAEARSGLEETRPGLSRASTPQTRVCLPYCIMLSTYSCDITGGLSPTTFLWKKLTWSSTLQSPAYKRSVSDQTPSVSILGCLAGLSRLLQLCIWLFTASQLWEAWEA